MAGHVDASDSTPRGHGPARAWLLPAGTFLAGCVLGGTLVGIGAAGGDDPDRPPASTAAPGSGAGDEQPGEGAQLSEDAGSGLYVRVPDACVQTAREATTLVQHVDAVVAAIAELQPERLRQRVDAVQQVREQVSRVAGQCREEADRRLQDAAGTETTPAP